MSDPQPPVTLPPQHTSFVGRETEIAEILALLDDPACRLLTLVGMGGTGKTRLAIETAQRLNAAGGVCFVALQPLQAADQVTGAILNSLNLYPDSGTAQKRALLDYLPGKRLLLVLDNFEHVLDAAGLVTDILDTAPQVKLMVTSREPLNLREEWVREVRGLHYPGAGTRTETIPASAVQLFAERARQLNADFSLEAEYKQVVRICQLVDGLPLALELAAGWLRTLSCALIAGEIERNLDILAAKMRNLPQRHQSMRAVFDHSWRLLSDDERRVMRGFAVFRGGCTRAAAEQVVGSTLPLLAGLVEKSLLRFDPATGRYDIQELLRQYAQEQLAASGDMAAVQDAHAGYYLRFFGSHAPDFKGPRQVAAYEVVEADFENIRLAWHRAVEQADYTLLDEAVESIRLIYTEFSRGRHWRALMFHALAGLAPPPGADPHPVWCRIRVRSARSEQVDLNVLETCLRIAREANNLEEIAMTLSAFANQVGTRGDYSAALRMLEESLQLYQQIDAPFYRARVMQQLAYWHEQNGQLEEARRYARQSQQVTREIGDFNGLGTYLAYYAWLEEICGHYTEAERLKCEAQEYMAQARNVAGAALAEIQRGRLRFWQGDIDTARRLVEQGLDRVRDVVFTTARIFGPLNRALIACVEEDYDLSQQLCEAIKSDVNYDTNGREIRHLCLAMFACGLGRYDEAQQQTLALLELGLNLKAPALLAWNLPLLAILLAQAGEPERAAELLGLVFTHTASATGWLEQWPLVARLQAQLKRDLGETDYARAWSHGASLDLEDAATSLMNGLRPPQDSDPNQTLAEPLTPREQDVLRLLARGYSNREIADILVLSVGTVKGYVHVICQKLDTRNRTQAAARAREFGLLGDD